MPRRSVLSASERDSLLAPRDDESQLIRFYTFSETDHALIQQRRGEANDKGRVARRNCPMTHLADNDESLDEEFLQYLSPLDWDHINVTGDYVWSQNRGIVPGQFRPLRATRNR